MPNIKFITRRRVWYTVSLILVIASICTISIFGFKFGLDFTGGSLLEISYLKTRPAISDISSTLQELGFSSVMIQPSDELDAIIRLPEISEDSHQKIVVRLAEQAKTPDTDNTITEKRFESFGPSISSELRTTAVYAIIFAMIAIISYLAYSFRKVSKPVTSWKFGVVAIIALFHDIIIVLGIFSFLGYFFNTEVNSFFITALLTLLGFSVHDTIVTLDRIRENLFKQHDKSFEEIVNDSINQTIARSINTSLATLFALIAIFFFGGESIKDFSLALAAGIIVGTYSSIFIAAPLLVSWYIFSKKRQRI